MVGGRGGGCACALMSFFFLWLRTVSVFATWAVLHLSVDCCPLREEAALTKAESFPGLWVQT